MSASIGITLCLIHITLIWMQIKPHDSFKLIWEYISISNAKTACQNTYGTDLASIHSALDQKEVTDLCTNLPSNINPRICWLGATMDGDPCAISWDDQTPYDHTPIFDIGEGCNQGQPRLCIVEDRYGLHDCNEAHNGFPICNYNLPIDCSSATAYALDLQCPVDETINIQNGESTDPSNTGSATCSGTIAYTDYITADEDCPLGSYEIDREWTCTAQCQTGCIQKIEIEDRTTPNIQCPDDVTVAMDGVVSPDQTGRASCASNDLDPTVNYWDSDITYSCSTNNGFTRTWTCDDCAGESAQCEQEINYNVPDPDLQCPINVDVQFGDSTEPSDTGRATCSYPEELGSVDINFDDEYTECVPTMTRTWRCSSQCERTAECNQIINITDYRPPILKCPDDVTVLFGETQPSNTGSAICTHTPEPITVDYDDEYTECAATMTRTWRCNSQCGTAECNQIINLNYSGPPVLTCPSDFTAYFSSDESTEPSRTGSAICTPETLESVDISYMDSDRECERIITRKWGCTTQCGAIAEECNQTITIHDAIHCPADADVNWNDANYLPSKAGSATCTDPNGIISYFDGCLCNHHVHRDWSCVFCNGKSVDCTQNIYNVPVHLQCPPDISIREWEWEESGDAVCSTPYPEEPHLGRVSDSFDDPQCAAKVIETVTWTCSVDCDHEMQCTQEVTVLKYAYPEIQCPGDIILFLGDSQEVDNTGSAICSDWYSTNPTVTHTDETKSSRTLIGCTNERTLTRKWMCSFCNGQTTSCDQSIKLCDDIVSALRIYNFHEDYGIGWESPYSVRMVFVSALILMCIATYVCCCIKKALINRGFEAIPKGIDSDSDSV